MRIWLQSQCFVQFTQLLQNQQKLHFTKISLGFPQKKGYHKFDYKTLLQGGVKCCFYLPFHNPRGHLLKNPKGESLFSLFLCEV
jgi:hypothetical protein